MRPDATKSLVGPAQGDADEPVPPPAVANLEAEVVRARERVASSLDVLASQLSAKTDWRKIVARHPLAITLGAFALGAALAWVSRPRPAPVASLFGPFRVSGRRRSGSRRG